MQTIGYVFIIFSAFGGFLLSFYIRHKKRGSEKLVCPIGSDCDAVIHSEYSRFFGIPVELLGLLYYGAVAFSYAFLLLSPASAYPLFVFLVITASTTAFFSRRTLPSFRHFSCGSGARGA